MQRSFVNVTTSREGVVNRRGFVRQLATSAGAGALALSWRDMLLARTEEIRKSGKRMILLWMVSFP